MARKCLSTSIQVSNDTPSAVRRSASTDRPMTTENEGTSKDTIPITAKGNPAQEATQPLLAYIEQSTKTVFKIISADTSMKDLAKCFSRQKSNKSSLELKRVKLQQDGSYKILREKVKPEDIPDFRAQSERTSIANRCEAKQLIQHFSHAHQKLSQPAEGRGRVSQEKQDDFLLPLEQAFTDDVLPEASLSSGPLKGENTRQVSCTTKSENSATIVTPCADNTNCGQIEDDPLPIPSAAKPNRKLYTLERKDSIYLIPGRSSFHLRNIQLPKFFEPDNILLKVAHEAIKKLLPHGDCESFDSVLIAQAFYEYWRPEKPRVILMAESHVFTEFSELNPKISQSIAQEINYHGPRDFVSLVYCLAYGEKECLDVATPSTSIDVPKAEDVSSKDKTAVYETQCKILTQASNGTPQFWNLLAGCLGQNADDLKKTPGPAIHVSKKRKAEKLEQNESTTKSPSTARIARLRRKLQILQELKDKGIWLIDASIVGWYIPQQQEYAVSKNSFTVHKLDKKRPPPGLKTPTLLLSWELYIKHVIRKHASSLRLLIPIGKEVERAITVERMRLAAGDQVRVMDSFPAPNAWCVGGYGPVLEEIRQLVSTCLEEDSGFPVAVSATKRTVSSHD